MYDIYFKNISVIDGTGAPAFTADVAVEQGKLVLSPANRDSAETIDGTGLTLCPGFIDAHSHGDSVFGTEVGRLCKTSQGITTELTGQCGSSRFPVLNAADATGITPPCATMEEYLRFVNSRALTANCKVMVGHKALRIAAMGYDDREPTAGELEHMKAMLREAMEHGCAGMSSGLIYPPSAYATEDEMVELCKIVAEFDGIYATHMRNEASQILKSVAESISVAERSGCRLDISHHKVCGKENWGLSVQTLRMIHEAIGRGVRVTMDVYPYTASSTGLNVCLPSHFFSHGPKKMYELLRDSEIRKQLKKEMEETDGRYRHCGFDKILMTTMPMTPAAANKTVAEYAAEVGKDPFEAYFDLVAENGGAAQAIYFSMCEEDLQRIMLDENAVVGTDGVATSLTEPTHPRSFASFPKAIRYFVREKKLLTLEQMIHKMTQLPAQRLLVPNKGVIATGFDADLVLFKADEITDRATYTDSLSLCDGIERVIVGGVTVYKDKQLTGSAPGKFIPHPGKQ